MIEERIICIAKICGTIFAIILLLFSIYSIALSIEELNIELFIYGYVVFCICSLMILRMWIE